MSSWPKKDLFRIQAVVGHKHIKLVTNDKCKLIQRPTGVRCSLKPIAIALIVPEWSKAVSTFSGRKSSGRWYAGFKKNHHSLVFFAVL